MAIAGLLAISLVMFNEFDTATLVNPMSPISGSPSTPGISPDFNGTLAVFLFSNQDQNKSDGSAIPTNQSVPLPNWTVTVTQPALSSYGAAPPLQYIFTTNAKGLAGGVVTEGAYVVNILDETLNVTIPVAIYVGNETLVQVTVSGAVHPLLYSEESGVLLTPTTAQYGMYVELHASTSVANASESAILNVQRGTAGYSVNATVLLQEPPTAGTQWLELATPSLVNSVSATSISLTTWSYASTVKVTANTLLAGAFK